MMDRFIMCFLVLVLLAMLRKREITPQGCIEEVHRV